jgi:hypothetical protein
MTVNRTIITALLAVTTFAANAAVTPEINFNVEATIPASDFYVTAESGWDASPQKMVWNEASSSLSPLTKNLSMKNSGGGIKAYLAAPPTLVSDASNIPLSVTVAGQPLPTNAADAVEVISGTTAAAGRLVGMTVSQTTTGGTRPTAGTYMGTVTMIFDTVPASAS